MSIVSRHGRKCKRTSMEWPVDLLAEMKEHARQRRMSLVAWLENAARSQMNREARYAKSSKAQRAELGGVHRCHGVWPLGEPCPTCGKTGHCPIDAHPDAGWSVGQLAMLLEPAELPLEYAGGGVPTFGVEADNGSEA